MSAGGCDTSGLKPVDEAIAELLARVPALPPALGVFPGRLPGDG